MSKTSVLVIDTDAATVAAVSQEVNTDRADIVVVDDVGSAHDYCKKRRPSLIILNVDLPKGWLLCTELKKSKRFREVPLVVLSAKASEEIFQQHMNLPTRADAYYSKPLEQARLSATFIVFLDYDLGDPVDVETDELDFDLDFELDQDSGAPSPPPKAEEIFDPTELQDRIKELEDALKRERDGFDDRLNAQAETGRKNVLAAQEERDEARAKVAQLQGQLETASDAASAAGDAATVEVAELSRQMEELRQQKEALEVERDAKNEQAGAAAGTVEKLTKEVEELKSQVTAAEEERDEAQQAAADAAQAAADAASSAQQLMEARLQASSDIEKNKELAKEAGAAAEAAQKMSSEATEAKEAAETLAAEAMEAKEAAEKSAAEATEAKEAAETLAAEAKEAAETQLAEAVEAQRAAEKRAEEAENARDAAIARAEDSDTKASDNQAAQQSALEQATKTEAALRDALEGYRQRESGLKTMADNAAGQASELRAVLSSILIEAQKAMELPAPAPVELAAPPAEVPSSAMVAIEDTIAEADEVGAEMAGPDDAPPPLPDVEPDPVIAPDLFAAEPDLVDIQPFGADEEE